MSSLLDQKERKQIRMGRMIITESQKGIVCLEKSKIHYLFQEEKNNTLDYQKIATASFRSIRNYDGSSYAFEKSPLYYAARYGHTNLVQLYLSLFHIHNYNINNNTPSTTTRYQTYRTIYVNTNITKAQKVIAESYYDSIISDTKKEDVVRILHKKKFIIQNSLNYVYDWCKESQYEDRRMNHNAYIHKIIQNKIQTLRTEIGQNKKQQNKIQKKKTACSLNTSEDDDRYYYDDIYDDGYYHYQEEEDDEYYHNNDDEYRCDNENENENDDEDITLLNNVEEEITDAGNKNDDEDDDDKNKEGVLLEERNENFIKNAANIGDDDDESKLVEDKFDIISLDSIVENFEDEEAKQNDNADDEFSMIEKKENDYDDSNHHNCDNWSFISTSTMNDNNSQAFLVSDSINIDNSVVDDVDNDDDWDELSAVKSIKSFDTFRSNMTTTTTTTMMNTTTLKKPISYKDIVATKKQQQQQQKNSNDGSNKMNNDEKVERKYEKDDIKSGIMPLIAEENENNTIYDENDERDGYKYCRGGKDAYKFRWKKKNNKSNKGGGRRKK